MKNQLRQIRDIQQQADKICNTRVSFEEVIEFGKYSAELSKNLKSSIQDDFTYNLISEIPILQDELSKTSKRTMLINSILIFIGGAIPFMAKNSIKLHQARPIIREIQGKYASIEFILKKY